MDWKSTALPTWGCFVVAAIMAVLAIVWRLHDKGKAVSDWQSSLWAYGPSIVIALCVLIAGILIYKAHQSLQEGSSAGPQRDSSRQGKLPWQKLQWCNAERERLEKQVEQLKAAQSTTPSAPPKLTIHRAVYGAGPLAEVLVTDKLQNAVREALIIAVDSTLGGLIDDPARNVQKHLEVEYSFGSDRRIPAFRMEALAGEITRLVLPEDTEIKKVKDQIAQLKAAQPTFVLINVTPFKVDEKTVSRGRTLKIRYEINSSENVPDGVWLGGTLVYKSGGSFSSGPQDQHISLSKGVGKYERDFTVPMDAPLGNHTLKSNVWYKSDIIAKGGSLEIVVVA
jgi:hypothetical protein